MHSALCTDCQKDVVLYNAVFSGCVENSRSFMDAFLILGRIELNGIADMCSHCLLSDSEFDVQYAGAVQGCPSWVYFTDDLM